MKRSDLLHQRLEAGVQVDDQILQGIDIIGKRIAIDRHEGHGHSAPSAASR